jgi:hypothetical protein
MILLTLSAIAFVLSLPLFMKHAAYKRRYRKVHPGCAWIPPTGNLWVAACLLTFAAMSLLFYVDPASFESFKGALYGTF